MTSLALFVLFAMGSERSHALAPPMAETTALQHSAAQLDLYLGHGEPLNSGDRYTITYKIEVLNGKELADSEKRGLPYSKELGDGHDSYFDKWAIGMREGGMRRIMTSSLDPDGPPLFQAIPPSATILVTLRLVGIKRTH